VQNEKESLQNLGGEVERILRNNFGGMNGGKMSDEANKPKAWLCTTVCHYIN